MAESGRTTLNKNSRADRNGKKGPWNPEKRRRTEEKIKYKIKTMSFVDGSIVT